MKKNQVHQLVQFSTVIKVVKWAPYLALSFYWSIFVDVFIVLIFFIFVICVTIVVIYMPKWFPCRPVLVVCIKTPKY